MEGLKAILERRSYRVYKDAPVPEDVIGNLLKAGMYAPSAMNSQPWEFLVVRDAVKLAALSEIISQWIMTRPCAVRTCIKSRRNLHATCLRG